MDRELNCKKHDLNLKTGQNRLAGQDHSPEEKSLNKSAEMQSDDGSTRDGTAVFGEQAYF